MGGLNCPTLLRRSLRGCLARGKRFVIAAAGVLGAPLALEAFPPAPYYTVYGDVRDAHGDLLPSGEASVLVFADGQEIFRQTLSRPEQADYNYQVRLRVDMMRGASSSYSSLALNPGDAYTIAVDVGGERFYPLEIANPPQMGAPAERRRLDLTLGIDSDGDGLPDAWEESQLYEAGYLPGSDGWDLSLIDRESDFDEDGVGNWAEYVAGTYALEHLAVLQLEIKEFLDDAVRLEFYAIYGRTYRLESSTDLEAWSFVSLVTSPEQLGESAPTAFQPETSGIASVYAPRDADTIFYRLIAQ